MIETPMITNTNVLTYETTTKRRGANANYAMSLYKQIDSVIASIAGSTCSADFPDLPSFVALHLHAAAGRAEAAIERSHERSAAIRGAVREAVGALPLTFPLREITGVVHRRMQLNPDRYGLRCAPSAAIIRAEVYAMQRNSCFSSEASHTPLSTGYA